jgi:hypothetical protein
MLDLINDRLNFAENLIYPELHLPKDTVTLSLDVDKHDKHQTY